MAFKENLRQYRKAKGLGQEDLAQLLDVSRQSISKWEQGNTYPDVEHLLHLAKVLQVSLDDLVGETYKTMASTQSSKRLITIISLDNKVIQDCYKIVASPAYKATLKYALFGVDGTSFWGDTMNVLGWYKGEEHLNKEIQEIVEAMDRGDKTYYIKYASHVKRKGFRLVVTDES